jgi:hypothetical protein
MRTSAWLWGAIFLVGCGATPGGGPDLPETEDGPPVEVTVPAVLAPGIASITAERLGGAPPAVQLDDAAASIVRVRLRFTLPAEVQQDDWRVVIKPSFTPTFHHTPHLTPTADHIAADHSFRSPALIVADDSHTLAIVPDLDLRAGEAPVRWYLDLDAEKNELVLGMSEYDVREHVLYVRKPGARYPAGEVEVGFYAIASGRQDDPFRAPLALLWRTWGRQRFAAGEPLAADLSPYVGHTYRWAFESWAPAVWQEFDLGDGAGGSRHVGAPVFIVNQTQSPNYQGAVSEREFRSVWNQAWFQSLRSASGVYRHARRTGDEKLRARALLTKELALAAPQEEGIFPSVVATEMEEVTVGTEKVRRSKGWETAFWGNSDRNPVNRPASGAEDDDIRKAPYHVLDMSLTALWMLRWNAELEKDERLLAYARSYGDALLGLQRADGFFPAWLAKDTRKPLGVLDDSAETSASATFLIELATQTGEAKYAAAARASLEAVLKEIVPTGRWEDFETYWSCAPWGNAELIGKRVARNKTFKQNTFAMFWTAEALYTAYKATGERRYLQFGQRVLDQLLTHQASWQPPYMHVNVLGGFGVMNADGEWNDARSSLFAELIIRYGQELALPEYVERGLAAMRSSFVMMYCPENPVTRAQWEKKYPWFGPADYGFTMENYGHNGKTGKDATGMGVFTIYDWGNGAAAEAYERLLDHFGEALVLQK